jgi:hypothetical protein
LNPLLYGEYAIAISARAANLSPNFHSMEFVYIAREDEYPPPEPMDISNEWFILKCCGLKRVFIRNPFAPLS